MANFPNWEMEGKKTVQAETERSPGNRSERSRSKRNSQPRSAQPCVPPGHSHRLCRSIREGRTPGRPRGGSQLERRADNDSPVTLRVGGSIRRHSDMVFSEGHDSVLLGCRPEVRQGRPEDAFSVAAPGAPTKGH